MISMIYIGPEEEGLTYMQPLIDQNPILQSVGMIPWNKLISDNRFGADAFACLKGGNHSVFGMNVKTFDVATFSDLVDEYGQFYAQNPTLSSSLLVLEMFPNNVTKQVADSETAYPYRDSLGYL